MQITVEMASDVDAQKNHGRLLDCLPPKVKRANGPISAAATNQKSCVGRENAPADTLIIFSETL
ncbi:MAG: hypothetical protein DMF61_03880 [Blastocatellia bacterium AA13]|nr:MAG: hypothetical protein DMF61_03880 [Blastocatellia bacterium AA13]